MIDIQEIKNNEGSRNEFIEDYKPFIASSVYSIIGRRVEYGIDDELQIALIAFNHAIDAFDGRGSFLSFAKLVIRNRIFDYFRSNKRHQNSEPIFDGEDKENFHLQEPALQKAADDEYTFDLRQEIELLSKQLSEYDIKFSELAKSSPKHKGKRKIINGIVKYILEDAEALKYFESTKNLPLKYIEDRKGIPRKNIEPYRKYVISLLLIAKSNYYYLKEYLVY